MKVAPSAIWGPVVPGQEAIVRLRPLAATRITSGFWADRQRVNRERTIPSGGEQLERAGEFHNLRLAAGRATGRYRTLLGEDDQLPFLDSDVYKWLEAIGWELGREVSPELEEFAREASELIGAAQREDGYLNSYYQVVRPDRRFVELPTGHELYCAGHLIQAAVAHLRAAGSEELLAVARRFADLVWAEFGPEGREGVCGHPEIEMALVELHRLTGESRYLELARLFVERRGRGLLAEAYGFGPEYFQDHEPVRAARTVAGHAVRQLYLLCGAVDVAVETGDAALLAAVVAQWEDMVAHKTYLTGGVGSRHRDESFGDPYELPPNRAYAETCAAIASFMLSWRLLLATGDGRYADLAERTLYNAVLPAVALDGRGFFYVNPLQVRADHHAPADDLGAARRAPWYRVACCPPNIMRIISSLDHYVATADRTGVQLHQYAGGRFRGRAADGEPIGLDAATDYPWDGRVTIEVTETGQAPWALSVRIPGWCTGATATLDGLPAAVEPDGRGYYRLVRRWRVGDRLVLDLPMPPRLTAPHPRMDAIRGTVAIERGPLVYCLEQADLPAGVPLDDVVIRTDTPLRVVPRPDLLGGVSAIEAEGTVRPPRGDGWPYTEVGAVTPDSEGIPSEPIGLVAVPYFGWANRTPGPMRVWIPVETPA